MIRSTLRSAARAVLPEGLLEARRRVRTLRRLGLPAGMASKLAWTRAGAAAMGKLPLESFPAGSFPVDVAVDVGAYDGRFSEALLAVLRPARLYAFEPTPASFSVLEGRLGRRTGVVIRRCAVGARTGRARFHTYECGNGNSLHPMSPEGQSLYTGEDHAASRALFKETVEVEVERLDELLPARDVPEISLLKVDVQGAERGVIEGAHAALARTRLLMIEALFVPHYEGAALFPELDGLLRAAGMTLHALGPGWHGPDGRLLHADAIYRRA